MHLIAVVARGDDVLSAIMYMYAFMGHLDGEHNQSIVCPNTRLCRSRAVVERAMNVSRNVVSQLLQDSRRRQKLGVMCRRGGLAICPRVVRGYHR